jgi:hypothetical protein
MFGKIVGTLAAAGLGYFGYLRYQKNAAYNANDYPSLLDQWNQSFYCHRCEHVFKV